MRQTDYTGPSRRRTQPRKHTTELADSQQIDAALLGVTANDLVSVLDTAETAALEPAVQWTQTAARTVLPHTTATAQDETKGAVDEYEASLQARQQLEDIRIQQEAQKAANRLYGEKQAREEAAGARASEAYVDRMLAQRDLAQQLAVGGYSGGMSEQVYRQVEDGLWNGAQALAKQLRADDRAYTQSVEQGRRDTEAARNALEAEYLQSLEDYRTQLEQEKAWQLEQKELERQLLAQREWEKLRSTDLSESAKQVRAAGSLNHKRLQELIQAEKERLAAEAAAAKEAAARKNSRK